MLLDLLNVIHLLCIPGLRMPAKEHESKYQICKEWLEPFILLTALNWCEMCVLFHSKIQENILLERLGAFKLPFFKIPGQQVANQRK